MPEHVDTLRRTLRELTAQRERLDADIRDLGRIIARYEGTSPAAGGRRQHGMAAAPGEGRRQTLELMGDGTIWTPVRLARERGTTPNAASAMLKRLAKENPPVIRQVGNKPRYRIASPKGDDAQGSLSVDSERDEQRIHEEVTL